MGQVTASRARTGPWLALPALAPLVVWLESARAGRVLAPGDGLTYYLPVHVLAARTWSQGVVPGWDPWSFGGSPLLATSQVGALYPPNLVHLLLPAAAAHDLLVMTAFAVAGVGAALLARSLTGDPVAGAACGLAFGLSGFFFGHLNHLSMVATAAWLPWALWGVERLVDRPRPIRLLAAAAPLAAAALAGHPQLFLVVLAVTALWGVGVGIDRRAVRPALLAGGAIVAGVLLGAVQLAPVAAHLGGSDRSSLAFGEAMSWSFSPSHSLLALFPHLFGTQGGSGPFTVPYGGEWSATELSGYVGAAALVLAGVGLGPARRAGRLPAALLVAVVATLVALGDSTPFGRLLHALPVIGQLRSWGRATVALDLVVAVLAAYGLAAVRTGLPAARRPAPRRPSPSAWWPSWAGSHRIGRPTPMPPGRWRCRSWRRRWPRRACGSPATSPRPRWSPSSASTCSSRSAGGTGGGSRAPPPRQWRRRSTPTSRPPGARSPTPPGASNVWRSRSRTPSMPSRTCPARRVRSASAPSAATTRWRRART